MDKLISAETLDGGQLRKAATLKCDESILVQIRGKDCVALEMKYHKQCYKNYISFLTHHKEDPEATSSKGTSPLYGKSFEAFCEQFVQTKILLDEGIFYMNKVKDVFVSTVAEVENVDASNYKTSRLKQRMKKRFPQLVFHATKRKNKSEIVYSDCLKKADVVENVVCANTSQFSTTETESDSDVTRRTKSKPPNQSATLKEFYDVAMTLRMELEKKKKIRSAIIDNCVRRSITYLYNVCKYIFDINIY